MITVLKIDSEMINIMEHTLYFFLSSMILGRLTRVPSILYKPSTMTRIFFHGLWVLG